MAGFGPSVQGLLDLPVELIRQVADYFTFKEYAAARATCRSLDAALVEPFGKSYVRKMQVMRTDFSLQGLVDLSKSRLSPYLKHVTISMEEFPPSKIWNVGPYEVLAQRQRTFIREKKDLEMLKEAFTSIQVETVEIYSYYTYNPQAPWSTYGWRKVLSETTVDLSKTRPPANFDKTLAKMVSEFLMVLGAAGARPGRFEVGLASGSLRDDAFIIPSHIKHEILPVISHLESLSFPVELADRAPGIRSLPAENPNDATYNLRRFLRMLDGNRLRCLRLVVPGDHQREKEAFFLWLASTPNESTLTRQLSHLSVDANRAQTAPPPVDFRSLQELDLENLHIRRQTLLRVVEKFKPTLRTLRLSHCVFPEHIESEADDTVVATITDPGQQNWCRFLSSLASSSCGDIMRMISLRQTTDYWNPHGLDVLVYADNDALERWHTESSAPYSTIVDWGDYPDLRLQELFSDCVTRINTVTFHD